MNCVDYIVQLFETRGDWEYLGEPVSQKQQALQCVGLAHHDAVPAALIAAALLHDIGHLLTANETDQAGEDRRLPRRILVGEIARHLAHVGMGDGELERDARRGMPLDQAAIVEIGGGGPDAADQADMHQRTARRWMIRLAATVSSKVTVIRMKAMAPPNGQFDCCVN